MPFLTGSLLPYLQLRHSMLRLRVAALSAEIYAEGAKSAPDVIQIAQWRAKRTELSARADCVAAELVIETAKTGPLPVQVNNHQAGDD